MPDRRELLIMWNTSAAMKVKTAKYPSSKQGMSCVEQFLLKLQSLVVEICQTGNSIWRLRAFMLLWLPMISLIFLTFWEKKDENHFMSYWITITLCGESDAGGFVSLLMTGNIVFTLSLLLLIISEKKYLSCLFLFKIKNTKSLFINVIVNLFFCFVCTLLQFYHCDIPPWWFLHLIRNIVSSRNQ